MTITGLKITDFLVHLEKSLLAKTKTFDEENGKDMTPRVNSLLL